MVCYIMISVLKAISYLLVATVATSSKYGIMVNAKT